MQNNILRRVAIGLVSLMALLQGFYAVYAFIEPVGFSILRGTELATAEDMDWIKIYASRTLFIALITGLLLYQQKYKVLMWAALFATVMPITDAWLALEANAPDKIVLKHVATVIYLLATTIVLKLVVKSPVYGEKQL